MFLFSCVYIYITSCIGNIYWCRELLSPNYNLGRDPLSWDFIIIKLIAYNWVQYRTILYTIIAYNLIIIISLILPLKLVGEDHEPQLVVASKTVPCSVPS